MSSKPETDPARQKLSVRGRGATVNPAGRFERLATAMEPDDLANRMIDEDETDIQLKTELYKDTSRTIISFNDSPDLGFGASINPYRGCEHGCIYCYARPTHEYFGLSAGLDFETKIFVKPEAPEILRKTLASKSWQPQVMMMSGVTDCYQPSERKLKITRRCLEVLAEFRNPVGIVTKNVLVTRDIDVLAKLAEFDCAHVTISITSLDKTIARTMEPRASRPDLRLRAIRELSAAGIPVSVNVAPIVPGLTDHEIAPIMEAAAQAGATSAGYTVMRLPYGVKDLFEDWLEEHYPNHKQKVLNRLRSMRGGKLNDPNFGSRMRGEGEFAEIIGQSFRKARTRYGLDKGSRGLTIANFRRDAMSPQMSLL